MQLRSRPAGSIGLCGGSYCRRPSSGCARVVDCLAERTELTPSRLFSSARRNCSREAEDDQQVKLDGAVEAGAGCKSSSTGVATGAELQIQQDGFRQGQGRREREFCKCRNFGPSLHAQMELLLDL